MAILTRKQQQVFDYLYKNWENFSYPPTLEELCIELGLASRGSLYKHIMALVAAGLVESFAGNKHAGVRLTPQALHNKPDYPQKLPFIGKIAAGRPIEAIATMQFMEVPPLLKSEKPCYVLQVAGESMIDAGILDGDWVIIEQRQTARNGEIVVALIDQEEATLKYIEQTPSKILLHPANSRMEVQVYRPDQVEIQGVLIAQMRRYH
ncbi:MAG: transcriptional repressor LexA [Methylococcaceae bacterium]|nr:transcriptional repressor LexA [Methylococcaceae bacterium]